MIWKVTILLWVLFLIMRYLIKITATREEQLTMLVTGKAKMTPFRIAFMVVVLGAICMTIATVVWFLFFKL